MTMLEVGYEDGRERLLLWLPVIGKHVITPESPIASWATAGGLMADADALIVVVVSATLHACVRCAAQVVHLLQWCMTTLAGDLRFPGPGCKCGNLHDRPPQGQASTSAPARLHKVPSLSLSIAGGRLGASCACKQSLLFAREDLASKPPLLHGLAGGGLPVRERGQPHAPAHVQRAGRRQARLRVCAHCDVPLRRADVLEP